jgi:hypothetical protein
VRLCGRRGALAHSFLLVCCCPAVCCLWQLRGVVSSQHDTQALEWWTGANK